MTADQLKLCTRCDSLNPGPGCDLTASHCIRREICSACQREAIAERLLHLGADELRVVSLIVNRLATGQDEIGLLDIAKDPRDFKREALEEMADGMAYIAIELIRGAR